MTPKASNSSVRDIAFTKRVKYIAQLVAMNARRKPVDPHTILSGVQMIADRYEDVTGQPAKEAKVLEIGFGARPHRAFAMQTLFNDVTAVDLDQPVFGLADGLRAYKANGATRAIKGILRATIFDRGEWPNFHRALARACPSYSQERTNLVVDNAASPKFWKNHPGPYDLIFSTDVFEHILVSDLTKMLSLLASHLADKGICITRPCIFTGITGGHEPAWYPSRVNENTSDDAWRHLWDTDFEVDTYLNRLSRRDFVDLFLRTGFQILSDAPLHGTDFGRKHLTANIQQKLDHKFDDYELFSNVVEFVLSPVRA